MDVLRLIMRQTSWLHQVRVVVLLLYVLLLSSPRISAQPACGAAQTTPIRVQNAAGVVTLRDAVNCTGGGDVEANWVGSVPIDAPIAVAEGTSLSVTGEDALAEVLGDGSQPNGTRLFDVSPGGSLTLTQLKLSGGSAEGGGAIYSQSASLTLDNCTFDGNVATDGDGGAVWADGGNVTIAGGVFSNNSATRYGGAVYAVEGRLVVQGGSGFKSNKAIVGGAIFCGVEDEVGSPKIAAYCSIADAEFVSNSAARESQDHVEKFVDLDGGGAAMFRSASVEIADSVFSLNYALLSGGALHGGFDTNVSVRGCKFKNNTAEEYGGAISASSMVLGGSTEIIHNFALDDGGAVFGWDGNGTIVFNDVLCSENKASNNGGCFYGLGKGVFNNGTTMLDNVGVNGGSVLAAEGSVISVTGGTYTSRSSDRGGFLYAQDNTRVNITGGLFENSLVTRRGGVVYCNGNRETYISISGGTFRNNRALEMGGAIAVWGAPAVVKITGGIYQNNNAKYYGGFIFVEEGASFACEGATIRDNSADDQGGGIYAREATWVNSSCDLIENKSPQGAAIYLTNVKSATFKDHDVTDNLASAGSVVYVARSIVVAREVRFKSGVDLQDYSFNRAVQLDMNTTLAAKSCAFEGWLGDTVIYNANSAKGSLVMDSCDFSESSATFAVISPYSDAEIRNAVVSNVTFKNAVVNGSLALVDRALDCADANACGAGTCVDSFLGVLCECLEGEECLHDGGELSLHLSRRPEGVIFSPDPVSYDIVVSAAPTGTTYGIWNLRFEGGDLDLDVVPSSGVLHPGNSVTVSVTGTPSSQDVGGLLTNSFTVTSHSDRTTNVGLNVTTTFYLCRAYEYALPINYKNPDGSNVLCKQCETIYGEEGVNCTSAGATRASLPILPGFWRSGPEAMVVHECLHSDACIGATKVSSSDGYCADGYKGPYCAVCTDGYGRGVSNTCHFCDNTKAHLLFTMGTLFSLVMLLLLLLAVIFLIGGLDAIEIVRQSVGRSFPVWNKASSSGPFVTATTLQEHSFSESSVRPDSLDDTVTAAFKYGLEGNRSELRTRVDSLDATVIPDISFAAEVKCGGGESVAGRRKMFPTNYGLDDLDGTQAGPLGAVGDSGVELSFMTSRNTPGNAGGVSSRRDSRPSAVSGNSVGWPQARRGVKAEATDGGKPKCCGLGTRIKRFVSRLPLNKLKILVVVWQILAVCSSITGIEFPASYSRFLAWINVANFDMGDLFSASCLLPSVNFYQRLLVTTLTPLLLVVVLAMTYHMAKRRAGLGRAGVIARRSAWSRHVAAGLLLTFLVFTSASTAVFKTFACDYDIGEGQSYLRADYSLSCNSGLHMFFKVYAGLMILVYPIGIPVLYAAILWKHRELLNPSIGTETDGADETLTGDDRNLSAVFATTSKGQTKNGHSPQELHELDEKVKARRVNPELVPSMFLWKDFGPDLYYYEVIECGRRMLLTGVLVFIAPHSPTQVAMACMFAFASLLGFELMRPHMDPTDSWLYRLGCVIIFLSNFLALLIKVDAGDESNRAAFGVLIVFVNVLLVIAVVVTSWFAVQQSVDDYREDENSFAVAKTMLTADQYSSNTAQLNRGRKEPMSSASTSVRPGVPRSDLGATWRGSQASIGHHESWENDVGSNADPGLNASRGVNSATFERLQQESNARGDGSHASPRAPPYSTAVMF